MAYYLLPSIAFFIKSLILQKVNNYFKQQILLNLHIYSYFYIQYTFLSNNKCSLN